MYQEIVHRYVAIDRRPTISDCFALLDDMTSLIYPIERSDVDRARAICLLQRRLSSRDCLHLAVMERFGIRRVLTLDRSFDLWPGVTCLP